VRLRLAQQARVERRNIDLAARDLRETRGVIVNDLEDQLLEGGGVPPMIFDRSQLDFDAGIVSYEAIWPRPDGMLERLLRILLPVRLGLDLHRRIRSRAHRRCQKDDGLARLELEFQRTLDHEVVHLAVDGLAIDARKVERGILADVLRPGI